MYFQLEGGVRVFGDVVLHYFWFGFAVIFIFTRGVAVLKILSGLQLKPLSHFFW